MHDIIGKVYNFNTSMGPIVATIRFLKRLENDLLDWYTRGNRASPCGNMWYVWVTGNIYRLLNPEGVLVAYSAPGI